MYICICMYVGVYVCMYVCMYVCHLPPRQIPKPNLHLPYIHTYIQANRICTKLLHQPRPSLLDLNRVLSSHIAAFILPSQGGAQGCSRFLHHSLSTLCAHPVRRRERQGKSLLSSANRKNELKSRLTNRSLFLQSSTGNHHDGSPGPLFMYIHFPGIEYVDLQVNTTDTLTFLGL